MAEPSAGSAGRSFGVMGVVLTLTREMGPPFGLAAMLPFGLVAMLPFGLSTGLLCLLLPPLGDSKMTLLELL